MNSVKHSLAHFRSCRHGRVTAHFTSSERTPNLIAGDAGFTILELLVSLVLLALIMVVIPSTLKLAARASATATELIAGSDHRMEFAIIEQELAEAMPLLERDSDGKLALAFSGDAKNIWFVAPLANAPEGGGVYRIHLQVTSGQEDGNNALVWRLLDRSIVSTDAGNKPIEERNLIDGLASGAFRYFGIPVGKTKPEWSPAWTRIDRLPDLVEITLNPNGSSVPPAPLLVELKLRDRI